MSYAKEKAVVERKIKLAKRVALCVVVVIVALLCVLGYFFNAEGWKYKVGLPKIPVRGSGEMRLHFVSVGQGDCTIVEFPDGQVMLVDVGGASETAVTAVLRYCNALGIDEIDHLVVTHADYDHYGGAFTLLDYKRVKRAYLPFGQELVNARYNELYKKIINKGVAWEYNTRAVDIAVDGCTVAFLYPFADDTDDSSAVLWVDYAGVSVLLTGDMDADTESFCVREDKLGAFNVHGVYLRETEILKVAHHGSASATDADFVEYIGAETAVISCGANNAYGHPAKKTLDTLESVGVRTYRTDTHGHIRVTVKKDGTYSTDF